MAVLKNRAKMSTSTTGTGTITLGSAESGYQTFADAGVADGDVVRYVIEDGSNFEIGTGTYTATGTTLTRTVSESSNSDAAINLSGSATVFIGATAEDIPALYIANPVSATDPTAGGDNAVGIGDGADATGNDSIAIGTGTAAGLDSVAIGLNAASGTTTGSYNTSIGRSAATYLTTGSNNLAVGRSALQGSNLDKVTGSGNAAIGYGAGSKNAGGNNNIYFGTDAGNAITSGSSNTFIGHNADGAATTSQQTALGYQAETAGTGATAINNSYASGTDSFAAAIANNTSSYGATGPNSIAMGSLAKATAADAVAIGDRNVASGNGSVALAARSTASGNNSVSIGFLSDATGASSMALGSGYSFSGAQATFYNSMAIGQGSLSDKIGKVAISGSAFSSSGDGQHGIFVLRVATTNATATPLITGPDFTGSYTPDDENQIVLPNNSAYSFSGTIIARESATDGSDYASWEIKGALLRDANAASTVLGNGIVNKLYATSGASAWAIALSADTTNGGLKIEVTGAASTNIRWVATVNTSEVTYA